MNRRAIPSHFNRIVAPLFHYVIQNVETKDPSQIPGLRNHRASILTDPMATTSSIELLRKVGKTEGISFLLLMGIAMPLKYAAGMPLAVTIVGWIHGVLFVAFSLVLLNALVKTPLTFAWAVLTFIAALLPFGPFVIDAKLKRFETRSTEA